MTSSGFASNLKLKSMLVGIRIRFRKTENFFTFQKLRLPPDYGLVLLVVLLTPKPRQNRQVDRGISKTSKGESKCLQIQRIKL